MAHEITASDRVILAQKPAWHGLGIVLPEAPTPSEALKIGGFDWQVELAPMSATVHRNGQAIRLMTESRRMVVRCDNNAELGTVGPDYEPVQNETLANLATALAAQGDTVRVESAGTLQGGRKVWFLLRGQSFSVRDDEVCPYILLANAHDGTMSLRAMPTTVRVVCKNTWNYSGIESRSTGYSFRHTSGIAPKVEELRSALGLYQKGIKKQQEAAEVLASKPVTSETLGALWLDIYTKQFGAIPANPTTAQETRDREAGIEAFGAMARRFDSEVRTSGANVWTATNAYTGWLQHDRSNRRGTTQDFAHRRLMGLEATNTSQAFAVALASV